MAGTFSIPLTTLAAGSRDLGPTTVADADMGVRLTIDRTVTGGLNASPGVTIDVALFQSGDGGATWFGGGGTQLVGGPKAGRFGNADNVWVSFTAGASRQVKATVTVTGGSVTVQGTLTTG